MQSECTNCCCDVTSCPAPIWAHPHQQELNTWPDVPFLWPLKIPAVLKVSIWVPPLSLSTCSTSFSFLCTPERGYGIMVSLLSPQQIGIPVAPQMTAAVNPEGVKQGYTSPGGLFIPPIAPEEQKRQPQQIIQKPRSQAIPIVPPKVWYNCNGLCLGIGTSFLLNFQITYHFQQRVSLNLKPPNTTKKKHFPLL